MYLSRTKEPPLQKKKSRWPNAPKNAAEKKRKNRKATTGMIDDIFLVSKLLAKHPEKYAFDGLCGLWARVQCLWFVGSCVMCC